jgi:hypothetical protein
MEPRIMPRRIVGGYNDPDKGDNQKPYGPDDLPPNIEIGQEIGQTYIKTVLEGDKTNGEIGQEIGQESGHDPTNPGHYTRYTIQPMEFIQANNLPFWLGNVIKYALRYDAKDGVQDLKKARRYLDMQIEHTQGNPDWLQG